MSEPHPLVLQLRFTRSEFLRAIKGIPEADASRRILPMNCVAWNVGHLAWQEQRYFLTIGQGRTLLPEIAERFRYGAPASLPALADVLAVWHSITAEADPWLDTLDVESLLSRPGGRGGPGPTTLGNRLQRTIYHYWFHTGENLAIRQIMGHRRLPQFVGDIDVAAPYRPEAFPGRADP
jgi:hypothetical protein